MIGEGVSRRAFGGSAGTYNVHASELAHTRGVLKSLSATVVFLDDTQHTFRIDVSTIASFFYFFFFFFKSLYNFVLCIMY